MTTNFALSLSFDGIRLLQRVQDGWHLVGETDLNVPDLAAALAKLRKTALSLDPSGLRTKLLIPNEQIKYITLETAQTDLADVRNALEGATPYSVDELVIDFDRNGGRTFIAAVARETLDEAETFAKEHDFAPVAFAAIAEPMTFKSEVFFGPTSLAGKIMGGPVQRDDVAVVVTGTVAIPDPAPKAEAEPPLFTPRTRMVNPESVAPPAPSKAAPIDPAKAEASPKPDATSDKQPVTDEPEVLFTRREDPVSLAVPTGDAKGPIVVQPSKDMPPATAKPVTTTVREPTIAPIVQRTQKSPAPAPIPTPVAPIATPLADDMAAKGGFTSRRAAPAADPRPAEPKSEKQERKDGKAAAIATKQAQAKRGKPRFLGLILTAILLITMALIAFWASTLSEKDLAGWFGLGTGGIVETVAAPAPELPATDVMAVAPEAIDGPVATAEPTSETLLAALPQVRTTETGRVLSPAEADRIYAATGVWQRAPRLPLEPRSETLTLPLPSAINASAAIAQPALPDLAQMSPDLTLPAPINPPAKGTSFPRDENGFILATPEGTVTPQGAIVYAGAPSQRPPLRPTFAVPTTPETARDAADGVIVISGPPSIVPPLRPANATLPDAPEAATAGGVTLAGLRPAVRPDDLAPVATAEDAIASVADPALAGVRPKPRPAGLAPVTASAPEPEPAASASPDITAVVAAIAQSATVSPYVTPTARAVEASRRPDTRPRNFNRVVARATDLATQQAVRAATPAVAAPATPAAAAPSTAVSNAAARPSGAVPGGVAQAATLEGAIKLRDINLIGVYGRPNDRRALVRLGNGRYVKVEIGSSLDGGQVTAIGDNALNYVKRGKTYALQLPTG